MGNAKMRIKYLFTQAFVFAFIFAVIISPVFASEITSDSVIEFVNDAREKQGVSGLVENEKLMEIAQAKLNDMIKNKYFAHTSPSGVSPWHWFEKAGYDYRYAGENLAINFTAVEDQHKAWMESATHRKNILNSKYQEIGVAIGAGKINNEETSIITVQEFGTIAGAAQTTNNSKNFSSERNASPITEGEKLGQALFRDPADIAKPAAVEGVKAEDLAYQIAQSVAYMLFLISIALIPIAFLAIAIDKILFLIEKRNVISETN